MFGGNCHQVIALQWVFGGAHNALGHVPQQLFPQMQVADGGRHGDQFAVGAPGHGFAVHVADMPSEQTCGVGGGLVLPLPVADVEGHLDRQIMLLDRREKALERLDAAALQGLVVFHQQLHRTVAQQLLQRLQITVVGEVAE